MLELTTALEIVNIESLYINSLNMNGIHGTGFLRHRQTGGIIKIKDYNNMNFKLKRNYKWMYHMGVKQEIKENLWVFSLFTSNKFMNINDTLIQNIELTDNIHKYVNPPIIIDNTTLCEYMIFDDNIDFYPKYCIDFISNNSFLRVNELLSYSLEGYKKAITSNNFNNQIVVQDAIFKYYTQGFNMLNGTNLLEYKRLKDYLIFKEVNNSHIINFIENIMKNKNIKGEDIINKEIIENLIKQLKN